MSISLTIDITKLSNNQLVEFKHKISAEQMKRKRVVKEEKLAAAKRKRDYVSDSDFIAQNISAHQDYLRKKKAEDDALGESMARFYKDRNCE